MSVKNSVTSYNKVAPCCLCVSGISHCEKIQESSVGIQRDRKVELQPNSPKPWLSISRLNHSRVGPRDIGNKSVWHLAGVTNRGNKVNWNTSSITRSVENTCTSRSSVRRFKTRTRSWHTSIYTTGWVISGTTWCSHDTVETHGRERRQVRERSSKRMTDRSPGVEIT